ncbi:MAG: phosphoenolpyruvate carboxykinase domain-containing protein, partial [Candidatus Omnitrophota bacterium]|nr:phosphoenolpyruvate carboxykinase domain-containing protein [Candidatus Omnitrophota bacterium]
PMAMLPFCGYNMAEYFRHWLNMGKLMAKPPKIFHVNWFRMDEQGKFLGPGFCENLRILEWILDRCNNKVDALRAPIGYLPYAINIDMTGLNLAHGVLESLLKVDQEEWREELKSISKFFGDFKKDLPKELWQEHDALLERLKKNE